jgi:hypothetical protein
VELKEIDASSHGEFQDTFNEILDSDRLIVGPHPRSSCENGGDFAEGAVLAAVTELQTELSPTGSEQSPTANSQATVA